MTQSSRTRTAAVLHDLTFNYLVCDERLKPIGLPAELPPHVTPAAGAVGNLPKHAGKPAEVGTRYANLYHIDSRRIAPDTKDQPMRIDERVFVFPGNFDSIA